MIALIWNRGARRETLTLVVGYEDARELLLPDAEIEAAVVREIVWRGFRPHRLHARLPRQTRRREEGARSIDACLSSLGLIERLRVLAGLVVDRRILVIDERLVEAPGAREPPRQ